MCLKNVTHDKFFFNICRQWTISMTYFMIECSFKCCTKLKTAMRVPTFDNVVGIKIIRKTICKTNMNRTWNVEECKINYYKIRILLWYVDEWFISLVPYSITRHQKSTIFSWQFFPSRCICKCLCMKRNVWLTYLLVLLLYITQCLMTEKILDTEDCKNSF